MRRVCLLLCVLWVADLWAKNGFDLSDARVPVHQIQQGGPPRDGIPAIDAPHFVDANSADFMRAEARVLGLHYLGIARAYPIAIMNWHEIVNDRFDHEAVAITFCPLCGTGMAFSAQHKGQPLRFGVSGLLYQSDVLLYDRQTASLWSQIMMQAVSGPLSGERLQQIPMAHTTWQAWRARHPDTQVLSEQTGYRRDYSRDPYAGYAASPAIYFDINHRPPARYHPKEQVLGLLRNGHARAFPFVELSRQGKARFNEQWLGEEYRVEWDEAARTARIFDHSGNLLPTTIAFWFAWFTFYPHTSIYEAP